MLSATHLRSGSVREKSRSPRWVAVTTRGTFLRNIGPRSPCICALQIDISTALWPTLTRALTSPGTIDKASSSFYRKDSDRYIGGSPRLRVLSEIKDHADGSAM